MIDMFDESKLLTVQGKHKGDVGSNTKNGVAADFYGQRKDDEHVLRLDNCSTGFQDEVLAIKECARTLLGGETSQEKWYKSAPRVWEP